jgi:hypothetical protein
VLEDRAVLEELTRLRSEGWKATWNLLEPSAGPALAEAC